MMSIALNGCEEDARHNPVEMKIVTVKGIIIEYAGMTSERELERLADFIWGWIRYQQGCVKRPCDEGYELWLSYQDVELPGESAG